MRMTSAAGLMAALLATAAPATAAETLRVGDSFPVGHYIAENLAKVWMDRVTEKSGGEIKFEYFPAEQMGKAKDLLALTQSAALDVGYVGASYVSDKLPLSSVGELPEAFTTSCQGTKAFWKIAQPGGALDQAEFAPNGVRVLMVMVLPAYQIFTKDREITGADSFKGLKIRTTGGAKEIASKLLEAIPVQIPAPESREALSRGTLDALLFPNGSILPYEMQPFLKYATTGQNFGSFVVTYTISQQKWDSLSPEVQKVLAETGEETTLSACEVADQLDVSDREKIAAAGVKYVELPEADAKKVGDLMATVGDQWAADLEARGRPAKAILQAFRDAIE
ncbi:TRAP transporter substrate-binding protein DctP [Falsigemmobacter intermedius]|uniref:C4-dicarboxylate ABC transporter n=1 Tax=Falsigemmobacter intermedius TaxID=1553448 RepID=A0A444MEP7_9RHOB|nr:TRAP transporter substrate-binding protein DctP [Falsigemmobacter intermedius]RWY43472.1 C4-dicarboxylate ABC transporter [Falsigemmobacter intermedius]